MFNSFFVLNKTGSIIIEKHYRRVINRSVIDYFVNEIIATGQAEQTAPVIPLPKVILVNIFRDDLFYVALVTAELPPLMVIEFLHRVADIFAEYFGTVNEHSIKDNFVTVYQLLEELMDNGFPLTTEPGILREMIAPPTMVNRAVHAMTGNSSVQAHLPSVSSIPWRRTGIKYTSNEIYVDIIEEVDAIVESNGSLVSTEIQGKIMCNCKLSGMPDLTMVFLNPRILEDVRFHPCVRLNRFEKERVLSFVPPDGSFELARYRVNPGGNIQLPIFVKTQVFFTQNSGKFDLSVSAKNTGGKPLENLAVTMPMPSNISTVNASVNYGNYQYDPTTKKLKWTLGRMPAQKIPMLSGTASFQPGTQAEGNPTITAEFKINMFNISGLKVDALHILGEDYKPFKGVKGVTQSGKFQIRT